MGEGHLFQDPLPRPGWTPGWGHEQITLGDHKDPGYWGEGTGAAGLVEGDGADPSFQKDPECHAYTVTHTLSSHTRWQGVALGD